MALTSYLDTTRRKESGGRDDARNPNSSASGRYQITDATFRAYADRLGLKGSKNDPANQEAVMQAYTADSEDALRRAGLDVSDGNLYALHFLGQGGGTRILAAPDDARATDYVSPAAASANRSVFYRGGKPITVGEFKSWAGRGYGGPSVAGKPNEAPAPAAAPQQSASTPQGPTMADMLAQVSGPDVQGFVDQLYGGAASQPAAAAEDLSTSPILSLLAQLGYAGIKSGVVS